MNNRFLFFACVFISYLFIILGAYPPAAAGYPPQPGHPGGHPAPHPASSTSVCLISQHF